MESKVYSAGVETHGLNPYAVLVMKMDGIDISNNTSNLIDDYNISNLILLLQFDNMQMSFHIYQRFLH